MGKDQRGKGEGLAPGCRPSIFFLYGMENMPRGIKCVYECGGRRGMEKKGRGIHSLPSLPRICYCFSCVGFLSLLAPGPFPWPLRRSRVARRSSVGLLLPLFAPFPPLSMAVTVNGRREQRWRVGLGWLVAKSEERQGKNTAKCSIRPFAHSLPFHRHFFCSPFPNRRLRLIH